MNLIRKLYRILWNFPHNWGRNGWDKNEMTEMYWNGEKAPNWIKGRRDIHIGDK